MDRIIISHKLSFVNYRSQLIHALTIIIDINFGNSYVTNELSTLVTSE